MVARVKKTGKIFWLIAIFVVCCMVLGFGLSTISKAADGDEEDKRGPELIDWGWPLATDSTCDHFTAVFYVIDPSGIDHVEVDEIIDINQNKFVSITPEIEIQDDCFWIVKAKISKNTNYRIIAYDTLNNKMMFSLTGEIPTEEAYFTQSEFELIDQDGNVIDFDSDKGADVVYLRINHPLEEGEGYRIWPFDTKRGEFNNPELEATTLNGETVYKIEQDNYYLIIYDNNKKLPNGFGTLLFHAFYAPSHIHRWGEASYSWSEDENEVTAEHYCQFSDATKEEETVEVTTSISRQPTCEGLGERTLTAEFTVKYFETQTRKYEDIPALGHSYGDAEYQWSEDGKTCTAKRTCATDPSHVETETVESKGVVSQPPTCTAKGYTTYTAVFTNTAFTTQTIPINDIPSLGHAYENQTYEWSSDYTHVTASATCSRCGHTTSETTETFVSQVKPASCNAAMETTYVATFAMTLFEGQAKTVTTGGPKHPWNPTTYTWNEENASVTAKRVCSLDANHIEEETVRVTVTRTEPTYESNGEVVYTATFANPAFETQVKTEVIPKLEKGVYVSASTTEPTWEKGSSDNLQFIFTRSSDDETTFSHFQGIKIDDFLVDESYYTAEEGSVIITVKPEYLTMLSVGTHVLTAMFDDGDGATCNFTITQQSSPTPQPGVTTYQFVFNVNGHGEWPQTQTINAGETATRPADPTADGYVFGGWYTDSACTIAFNFNTPINQNTTVYAKWTMDVNPTNPDNTNPTNTTPSGSPATGDSSKPELWIVLMIASLLGIMISGMNLEEIRRRSQ